MGLRGSCALMRAGGLGGVVTKEDLRVRSRGCCSPALPHAWNIYLYPDCNGMLRCRLPGREVLVGQAGRFDGQAARGLAAVYRPSLRFHWLWP
jgi:hypothetical protein